MASTVPDRGDDAFDKAFDVGFWRGEIFSMAFSTVLFMTWS